MASYHGRTDIPVPVSVITPEVGQEHSGAMVEMKFVVEKDGIPRDIEAVGNVDVGLAIALKEALRDWRFTPALVDGNPVAVKCKLPILIHGKPADAAMVVARK